jgi:hypothetical protein
MVSLGYKQKSPGVRGGIVSEMRVLGEGQREAAEFQHLILSHFQEILLQTSAAGFLLLILSSTSFIQESTTTPGLSHVSRDPHANCEGSDWVPPLSLFNNLNLCSQELSFSWCPHCHLPASDLDCAVIVLTQLMHKPFSFLLGKQREPLFLT